MYRDHPVTDVETAVDDTTQLIDVRQPDEVAAGTIGGAVNIPLSQLADRIGELDPARRVVLLCRSGGRSSRAANYLSGAGFSDVVNLSGGILAYLDAGHHPSPHPSAHAVSSPETSERTEQ
jgi:rhodanese-related sulfurtransferase